MLKILRWCLLGLCMMCGSAHAAPVLQVNANGILTGAKGVDVGGQLYDVEFLDGTCVSLFSGCDSVQDFDFTSDATATLASQALIDQVLLDGPQGSFNAVPSLTRGCILSNDAPQCYVFTPTWSGYNAQANNIIVTATAAYNVPGGGFILPSDLFLVPSKDLTDEPSQTWALWAVAVQSVVEPSALACLGVGLLGLVLARRSRIVLGRFAQ